VGPGVTQWRPGDAVFGLVRFPSLDRGGRGHAEYATSPAADLARKPASVDHVAGGVGHFLTQLARTRSTHLVAVASGHHEVFLRSLGVDEFIDYTTGPVEDRVRDIDHLIDTVGGPRGFRFPRAVEQGGTISPVFFGEYHREEAVERAITFPSGQVHSDGAQLGELARLIDDGRIRAGIDSVFALADAAKAHERAEQGHIQGKIVLRVGGEGR
jgi:NADPH:quinone reductase-like Zn-dependent oxidoreductase